MYRYLIVYMGKQKRKNMTGRVIFEINQKIDSLAHIEKAEKYISEKFGIKDLIIVNIIFLKKVDELENKKGE